MKNLFFKKVVFADIAAKVERYTYGEFFSFYLHFFPSFLRITAENRSLFYVLDPNSVWQEKQANKLKFNDSYEWLLKIFIRFGVKK